MATSARIAVEESKHGAVTIVVLGASGDLATKKTFPALFYLFKNRFLPKDTQIIGYARTHMNHDDFIQRVTGKIDDSNDVKNMFAGICSYMSGQYDQDESWQDLAKCIAESERKRGLKGEQKNRVFYMALPPSVFLPVAKGLRKYAHVSDGSNSIVVEKPFGKDLETCNKLLHDFSKLFHEKEMYRIDHYLGKEMAKDIMTLRFANVLFSPLWNSQHIDTIQITLKEPFGTEGRGGYFNEFGIIRDVMQNHLLQLMSLLAMERPVHREAEAIRDEKVKVLRCVKPIAVKDTLLGQYEANPETGKPGYLDDDTVPKDSLCPTFAALVLWVDSERWENVPFILKAGKALDNAKVEIRLQFKKVPGSMFKGVSRNELVLRVQPGEAVYVKFNNKTPGLSNETMTTELDLTYRKRYSNLKIPDAYESLILDILRGDHSNFVRDDELQAAWKIFTPLLHHIEQERIKPDPYQYGSRGPKSLQNFVQRYGVEHLDHEDYSWPIQCMKDT